MNKIMSLRTESTWADPVVRAHTMPFGSTPLAGGRVRFRLWAPAARKVSLCVYAGFGRDEPERLEPMHGAADGWFSLVTPSGRAGPGSLYHYLIDETSLVPDPASRFQPDDVHGPSEVIDPGNWKWRDWSWRGRPWSEAVIYELHVGAFTPQGTFAAIVEQLDSLKALGITAIELMPVADFPGAHNWGYDGVLPFAPDSRYGRPEDFKSLVEAAHQRGIMVLLDVVYNHFGPEGNYLHLYAPQFFGNGQSTPWGESINFSGSQAHWVRQFFIHNALYWLEEYNLDGLRLDAVHAISDDATPSFLEELAGTVRHYIASGRHVHLVLENDNNAAHFLHRDKEGRPQQFTAQWNDDFHHCLHVLLTGESTGYYQDYMPDPTAHLGRCLGGGFAFQGERSPYRHNRPRGEPSTRLPADAFVAFLQNHDQIGNRPGGERLTRLAPYRSLRAATALLLLSPFPPLLFMGQEWGCRQPFPFFCDFTPVLQVAIREGRQQTCSGKEADAEHCTDEQYFSAVLDRRSINEIEHLAWLALHRQLLAARHQYLTRRLKGISGAQKGFVRLGERAITVSWRLGDGSILTLLANLGDEQCRLQSPLAIVGQPIYSSHALQTAAVSDVLLPWSVFWYLDACQAGEEKL